MTKQQAAPLEQMTTEDRNPASEAIDRYSAAEIVRLMNDEDRRVAEAVATQAEPIAHAIDVIAERLRRGGRLIYMGAGTSGRLGVLDASECPPTFSTPPEMVIGLIAGGSQALTRAIEGAEDHPESGESDLRACGVSSDDVVVGIATSGRTPYVIGGLTFANEREAFTIGFSCNEGAALEAVSKLMIVPVVGPEIVSGSTRLKAGTATKMVLNMLTTGAMVRMGKTYGNLMVDLRATNHKLAIRSRRIVSQLTGLDESASQSLLDRCEGEVKTAIVVQHCDISAEDARQRLADAGGHLRRALELEREDE
jgi:N-acetylmuramic acid 6-phosphate etherase